MKYRVKPGGKITIGIEGDKPVTTQKSVDPEFIGADLTEEQLYVLRKRGNITLYDLGVRNNAHSDFGSVTSDIIGGLIPAIRQNYHSALMFGDFLETMDFSPFLKLPQNSQNLYVDVVFRRAGEDDIINLIGNAGSRPHMRDYNVDPDLPPASSTNWRDAALSLSAAGDWQIRVEAGFFYNTFDTGDTVFFKMTRTNTTTAVEVDPPAAFSIKASDKVRVYLTPRVWVSFSGPVDGVFTVFSGRLPVTHDFAPVIAAPIFDNVYGGDDFITGECSAYFDAVDQYFSALNSAHVGLPNQTDEFNAYEIIGGTEGMEPPLYRPALVGIIVKNEDLFFVWRVKSIGDAVKWHDSMLLRS